RREYHERRDASGRLGVGARHLALLAAGGSRGHVPADDRRQTGPDHPDGERGPEGLVGAVQGRAGREHAEGRGADPAAQAGHDRRENDSDDEPDRDGEAEPLADGEEHDRAGGYRDSDRRQPGGGPRWPGKSRPGGPGSGTLFAMTDPRERPEAPGRDEAPRRRRAHTTSRDLERYAGLFARRTQVMRSSAMRDLMAITARPEVISLAGGLPDTS